MERFLHENKSSNSCASSVSITIDQSFDKKDALGEPNFDRINFEVAKSRYNKLSLELKAAIQKVSVSEAEKGQAGVNDFNLDEFLHGICRELGENSKKTKRLGVLWQDLHVEGKDAKLFTIPTILNSITSLFKIWRIFKRNKSATVILDRLTGCCRDGEMLLVLGRPGSGCSTFLKVIANLRKQYTRIEGDISYGGIDSKTFLKRYRGQVCYNGEEDQHYSMLTTKQTLEFALKTKTPGQRAREQTKSDFVNRILYLLGNMLGLTRQLDTMVGNASLGGLSGGERKRLSIAEQMTTHCTINCWDCSTRGLDAASALDYVRSLRLMTDIFSITTIATLYQASNSIYNLFDKVLVLDKGYCIYYGPVNAAKSYFESLGFYCPPRKSIPEFMTGLCNITEREVRPGFESIVPRHPSEFQEYYYRSAIYQLMMDDLNDYKETIQKENKASVFEHTVREEHQKYAPKRLPYIASFFQQVKALTIRHHYLLASDKKTLFFRYGMIILQAIVNAGCFFKLPLTPHGAFSRGGALFSCILCNTFISQTELLNFMVGRPVLEKHRQYALYSPSAFYIAQVITDVPYVIFQVFLFECCTYFTIGLSLSFSQISTFFVGLFVLNMSMNGFFRFSSTITSSFFVASQLSSFNLIGNCAYTGYTLAYNKMRPWFTWVYYQDPLSYTYKMLISNEMSGQIFSCEGTRESVPYGPGYDDWRYKVCAMKGAKPGIPYVRGDDYLLEAFDYKASDKWFPTFVIIIGIFLFYTLNIIITMELGGKNRSGYLTKLYLPGTAPGRNRKTKCICRYACRCGNSAADSIKQASTDTIFSWQNVNYTLQIGESSLQLLSDVCGIVKPGQLTAIMGSSGAGKTVLLDVLARRKTTGEIKGRVYLNGDILLDDFERITGYCEQIDIHQPKATVREALRFSACLRQPADVSKEEKYDYVEQIIELLELEDIADAQIGEVETGYGISLEERKRLSIGVELVSKPQLLFLDEPTSGLDAQSSYNIIRFIRKLADAGWPVLCSIHQPSLMLFEQFDRMLLLVRGGRTAYFGEIGQDARTMIDYFERHGAPKCLPDTNPAEYILDVVGAGTSIKTVGQDWADIWQRSDEAKTLTTELDEVHACANKCPTRKTQKYATSFITQLRLVLGRMSTVYWRSPDYNIGRFINLMATSLACGFTFWKLGNSISDLFYKAFALFITFIMALTLIILAQLKFMGERLYFRREYASGYYGWLPFGISVILVEIPYVLVLVTAYMCGFYWSAGMTNTAESCAYFFAILLVLVCWAITIGFAIAATVELPMTAAMINPVLISILISFCGLMQTAPSMPQVWKSWMYWVNPFHYYVEGLAVNELEKLKVECAEDDLLRFFPPPNQTCGEYTKGFLSLATGYIVNPEATQPELCSYCAYSSGAEYYETNMEWSADNKWRNLSILGFFVVLNIVMFLFAVYLKRKGRR
ncbi:hypothetical protein RMATCC62417_10044 [Rhizopus microsporus]|nr:hypothetical protein RMATCC62417_10044 [Rhizopus microsporus]